MSVKSRVLSAFLVLAAMFLVNTNKLLKHCDNASDTFEIASGDDGGGGASCGG
jgi:hypothetical protein